MHPELAVQATVVHSEGDWDTLQSESNRLMKLLSLQILQTFHT